VITKIFPHQMLCSLTCSR